MCERLKQAVLKTAVPERVPGVRIPPSPPDSLQLRELFSDSREFAAFAAFLPSQKSKWGPVSFMTAISLQVQKQWYGGRIQEFGERFPGKRGLGAYLVFRGVNGGRRLLQ